VHHHLEVSLLETTVTANVEDVDCFGTAHLATVEVGGL
jgi:hypothetical protein